MTKLRSLLCLVVLFSEFGASATQADPARGMVYCTLGPRPDGSGRPDLPSKDNFAILLENRFDQIPVGSEKQVLRTADPDNLINGHDLKFVRHREDGGYSFQSEPQKEQVWNLVLVPDKNSPVEGFYQAGLGDLRSGRGVVFGGFCGFVQMENAEAEFLAHPPTPSP